MTRKDIHKWLQRLAYKIWSPPKIKGENPPNHIMLNKTVGNTYEAAYYLIGGARISEVRFRKLPMNSKEMFSTRWIFEMEDIPNSYIDKWRMGQAVADVKQIEAQRKKIKKLVMR